MNHKQIVQKPFFLPVFVDQFKNITFNTNSDLVYLDFEFTMSIIIKARISMQTASVFGQSYIMLF